MPEQGYKRKSLKFAAGGINLNSPPDMIGDDEYAYLLNIYRELDGSLKPRPGLTQVGAATDPIHSIRRVNNTLPGAPFAFQRFVGAGVQVLGGVNGSVFLDNGYSGNPLSMVPFRPAQSPETWLYVADTNKMRKFRTNQGTVQNMGILPSNTEPDVKLAPPLYKLVTAFTNLFTWQPDGTSVTAIVFSGRIPAGATISAILYDTGTTGWACVAFHTASGDYTFIAAGTYFLFGNEFAVVEKAFGTFATTSIQSISYDSGSTGACTIQMATPITGLVRDQFIQIKNGASVIENVRVLSVTQGKDGLYSFRCSTVHTLAPGYSILSVPSVRAYLVGTHAPAAVVSSEIVAGIFHLPGGQAQQDGWVQLLAPLDFSTVSGRPITEDDYIHISLSTDHPENLVYGRLVFNVSTSGDTSFASNYYYLPLDPNDFTQASIAKTSQTAAAQSAIQGQQIRAYDPSAFYKESELGGYLNATVEPEDFKHGGYGAGRPSSKVGASRQMRTGQSAWTELFFKVSDLQRVGTDPTLSLANINGFRIELVVSGTLIMACCGLWAGGTYGPDVLATAYGYDGFPVIYRYRYRSSLTGAISVQSPAQRTGDLPRRQRMLLSAAVSPDPQVDLIDWERFGGAQNSWHYIGSSPNISNNQQIDDVTATAAVAADALSEVAYAPFPVSDQPKASVVNTVGTRVIWVSGDQFNIKWAPGGQVLINGVAYTLYAVYSAIAFSTVENIGTLNSAVMKFAEPTIMGQPLPVMWGPDQQGRILAAGDVFNPGYVYPTNADQDGGADGASDQTPIEVSSPTDPVMNGIVYEDASLVFTANKIIRLMPTYGESTLSYQTAILEQGRGLYARYGLCAGAESIFYIANDGIYRWRGSGSTSITDKKLGVLFPHGSQPGSPVVLASIIVWPPDYSQPLRMRLSYGNGYVKFNYVDTQGTALTLAYDVDHDTWWPWNYFGGSSVHYQEEGPGLNTELVGLRNGVLALVGGSGDYGQPIACSIYTKSFNADDTRARKQWGEVWLDLYTANLIVSAFPGLDNYGIIGPTSTVRNGVRSQFIMDLAAGLGDDNINLGVALSFQTDPASIFLPLLYEWQPSFLEKPEDTLLRATDWDDDGSPENKWLQGLLLNVDTVGLRRLIQVQSDLGGFQNVFVFANGQRVVTVSVNPPIIGHQFRLVPQDAASWRLFPLNGKGTGVRWVWETHPELTTNWVTQPTTHGLQGFQHLREAWVPYSSSADTTFFIQADGINYQYKLPSSGGVTVKRRLDLDPIKGKLFSYSVIGGPIAIFQEDLEVRIKEWGNDSPYQVIKPFGGMSRDHGGARI